MDYFPLSLATGAAFCNRKVELQHIHYNINNMRPTLIASPRRYGKTSLALQAVRSTGFQYAQFDFLSAVEPADVEKIILDGIGRFITKISKGPQKALKMAYELLSDLNIKISIEKFGISIDINKRNNKPAYNILKVIQRIEKLAENTNSKIVLFFDEFQHVYQITDDPSIESVLREVAQASKVLAFIFSGSNRHLLNLMFDDSNRPFYKLCDKVVVTRIQAKEYIPYIQNAAQERWSFELDQPVLDNIFEYTQRHPYYMNLLCSRLWQSSIRPIAEDVVKTWFQYVQEERAQVAAELDLMSKNQRKLLVKIAKSIDLSQPTSIEFQNEANMPGATIGQALDFLEKRYYVTKNDLGFYEVLDPLIKAVLTEVNL